MEELLKRLRQLLEDLDKKFQEEGLYPDEEEAREAARNLMAANRVYNAMYGEDLFRTLAVVADVGHAQMRTRLYDLENREGVIPVAFFTLAAILKKQGEKLSNADLLESAKVFADFAVALELEMTTSRERREEEDRKDADM